MPPIALYIVETGKYKYPDKRLLRNEAVKYFTTAYDACRKYLSSNDNHTTGQADDMPVFCFCESYESIIKKETYLYCRGGVMPLCVCVYTADQ